MLDARNYHFFFNDSSLSSTDKQHKLKLITASKLCLAFIDYVQHVTPKFV